MIRSRKWRARVGLVSAMAVIGAGALAPQAAHAEGTPKPPGPSGAQQKTGNQKKADAAQKNKDVQQRLQALKGKAHASPGFAGKWFVQFAEKPALKGGATKTIAAQQRVFRNAAPKDVKVTDSYSKVWNGVAVKAEDKDLDKILKAKNVKAVFPVLASKPPKEPAQKEDGKPNLNVSGELTGVTEARNKLGLTGKGVKIGIIDTGIDIDHPAFGGSGVPGSATFPTSKVVAGYDFVGDEYNGSSSSEKYNPVPKPDPLPKDCMGHGTSVASIAAGNDAAKKFKGVAPDAKLGAYKIAGCEGGFDSDVLLAAMERATKDGMDVVNMSLGLPFASWPNYPVATAADAMADSGIVLTSAAGNEGESGVFSTNTPSVARKAISVGSVDSGEISSNTFRGPDGKLVPYDTVAGSPWPPTAGKVELATYPDGKKTGGVDLPGTPFKGKAVLVSLGGNAAADQKFAAAEKDGAAAVVFYDESDSIAPVFKIAEGKPGPKLPVIQIKYAEAKKLETTIAAGPASIEWTDEEFAIRREDGGLVAFSSSFGLAADLTVKPDVLAPGESVYAAIPTKKQGDNAYRFRYGTSMASPHAAGAAALLLQSNTALNPGDVRTVLQNTAKPLDLRNPEALKLDASTKGKEPVHLQGAGLINVPAAVAQAHSHAKVTSDAVPSTVTPSKVSLGDTDSNDPTELTIANRSNKEVTYTLSSDVSPVGTAGPNQFPSYFAGLNTKVSFSAKTVTVPANSTRTVKATVTPPSTYTDKGTAKKLPWPTIYGGYLVLKGSNNTVQHIPFAGLNADYESLGFLYSKWTYGDAVPEDTREETGHEPTDSLNIQPSLGVVSSCPNGRVVKIECGDSQADYAPVEENDHVYSMKGYDVPRVIMHVENPVSKLEVAAYHANADGSKGKPIAKDNIVFSLNGYGFKPGITDIGWDGTVASGNGKAPVPDGRYVLEVTATKGTGHAQNGKNTDVFTSRPFVVRSNPGATPSSTASPTPSPTASPGQTASPAANPTAKPTSSAKPTGQPAPSPSGSQRPTATSPAGSAKTSQHARK
ncbi:PA domain protein [Actinomyces sp. oral taxon 848 str. F0332]|nr:PA domain protein [Actinomyces sp. oral taxon 848 str. F0332]